MFVFVLFLKIYKSNHKMKKEKEKKNKKEDLQKREILKKKRNKLQFLSFQN